MSNVSCKGITEGEGKEGIMDLQQVIFEIDTALLFVENAINAKLKF